MTFGQMQRLTQLFNQILGASQALKNERLESLLRVIVLLFPKSDLYAARMYAAVCEELK